MIFEHVFYCHKVFFQNTLPTHVLLYRLILLANDVFLDCLFT